ncbi:MAG: helix-turn-helix transcriptional regulator [Proteobacteria bacterium]|nr:helix-turn-helix transcriptional regulator [Pseudomonadota bacterium]MBU4287334.1 helix-turn-helix transcriptional regulator [Pseudomonadota bacterium]MBU4403914.1 helix-turn-helix transcriptional regulator [Actinomycetota bacterium]
MDVLSLRKKFNLTREDLASMLHVSSMAIYRWEKRRTKPRLIALKGLERIEQELERKNKCQK